MSKRLTKDIGEEPRDRLYGLILELQSGRRLDTATRDEIASALNTLWFLRQRGAVDAAKGRRVEWPAIVAAYLVHLLRTEHGALLKDAVAIAIDLVPGPTDKKACDKLANLYRTLKREGFPNIDMDPEILSDAATRLPASTKHRADDRRRLDQ